MDLQTIIAAIIILLALFFVGRMFLRKTKSFSTKGDCAADCGCDAKVKVK